MTERTEIQRLATIRCDATHELRVSLMEMVPGRGRRWQCVELRIWKVDADGHHEPTSEGIRLLDSELAWVRVALGKAMGLARRKKVRP